VAKQLVILSGGMDSTILMYDLYHSTQHEVVGAVSFNYGQRHKKELDYAKKSCDKLGVKHFIIDLWSSGFTEALSGSKSSLVTDEDVPDGHYAEENMKSTVVPNRNMVMIAIAGSIAVAEGANAVATAVHAGDHFVYPDCRYDFVIAAQEALYAGNEGFGDLGRSCVTAPYLFLSKEDIAFKGLQLDVPFEDTWSCYKGGQYHCGRCGTCVERLEAINAATNRLHPDTVPIDLTIYEDMDYWKEVTK